MEMNTKATVKLFTYAFLVFLVFSLLTAFFYSNAAIDLQLHDTYILPLGLFAFLYFLLPKLIRKPLNSTLGKIHFWLTVASLLILATFCYYHDTGIPRRYYSFNSFDANIDFDSFNKVTLVSLILFLIAQLFFLFNLIYSIFKS